MLLHVTIICFYLIFPIFAIEIYSKFHQRDYKIDFERVELVRYEKSVFNFFEVKTYKLNRTFAAANLTFNSKKTMSNNIEAVVQFYKFVSNEYRIFPTRFEVNACKSLDENIVGARVVYECGNFSTCNILKETTYKICNIYPDESRFPPFFPSGSFKARVEFVDLGQIGVVLDCFIRIYRPVAVPKKRRSID